jgi:transposase InsO family protein
MHPSRDEEFGLEPITWRTFVRTTDSRHALPVYPNLIKNRQLRAINKIWVADMTYIRIRSSFVYLAAILDLYSRRIVGWAISKRIDAELCVTALRMSLETRLRSRLHRSFRPRRSICVGCLRCSAVPTRAPDQHVRQR